MFYRTVRTEQFRTVMCVSADENNLESNPEMYGIKRVRTRQHVDGIPV